MSEIGAFDAKTNFSKLLARAAQGEEIVITHRGKAVAKLVPLTATHDAAAIRAALTRMRARARARQLGRFDWREWKAYRDEGR